MNTELMTRHQDFIARCKAKGLKFTSYRCPKKRCGFVIETRVAPKGEVWDTLATCPKCGDTHMKVTTGNEVAAGRLS